LKFPQTPGLETLSLFTPQSLMAPITMRLLLLSLISQSIFVAAAPADGVVIPSKKGSSAPKTSPELAGIVMRPASVGDQPPTGFATVAGGYVLHVVLQSSQSNLSCSTHGGKGGSTVTVSNFSQLQAAVGGNDPKIILVQGIISGGTNPIRVGSNKSIIGKDSKSGLSGLGLLVHTQKNVIIRNLRISQVHNKPGDAITIQQSQHVWVDHCDLSSDREHGKDYYDGLLDIVHGSDYVTVSYTHFHDHFKASLVGHSDKNKEQDSPHLRVTFYNNRWTNINSRTPSLRFGQAHIFNSYFAGMETGINARLGAKVLVQGNVFSNVSRPLYSVNKDGFASQQDNVFGAKAKADDLPSPATVNIPYKYTVAPSSQVEEATRSAGNTLSFGGK
jgi:pectate lyase